MFCEILDMLADKPVNFPIAAAHDSSSDRDVSHYVSPDGAVPVTSKVGCRSGFHPDKDDVF